MSNIIAGKFTAKIVDYAIRSTKNGDPEPTIRFRWDDHEWNWRGSLKEGKAREITLKALFACGFSGDDLSILAEGVVSGALDTDKELLLSVAIELGQDGKEYPVIKSINEIGWQGFQDTMDRGEAIRKMAGMNLKGEIAALKKSIPAATQKKTNVISVNDIPF